MLIFLFVSKKVHTFEIIKQTIMKSKLPKCTYNQQTGRIYVHGADTKEQATKAANSFFKKKFPPYMELVYMLHVELNGKFYHTYNVQ